jgi:hypothetical protein
MCQNADSETFFKDESHKLIMKWIQIDETMNQEEEVLFYFEIRRSYLVDKKEEVLYFDSEHIPLKDAIALGEFVKGFPLRKLNPGRKGVVKAFSTYCESVMWLPGWISAELDNLAGLYALRRFSRSTFQRLKSFIKANVPQMLPTFLEDIKIAKNLVKNDFKWFDSLHKRNRK